MSELGHNGFIYHGEGRRNINFPVGGIGAGCIGISASGRLTDWEIFNKPSKGTFNGLSHFAIKAEKNGKVVDARMLHGPYDEGQIIGHYKMRLLQGYGHGTQLGALAGMPHFKHNTFEAMFPTATLSFDYEKFPGKVQLDTFSSFIPLNSDDSSLPATFYTITVENNTSDVLDYYISSVLGNPSGYEGIHEYLDEGSHKTLKLKKGKDSSFINGDISLGCDAEDVSCQRYLFRGDWFDSLTVYWDEFNTPGHLKDRFYHEDEKSANKTGHCPCDHGALTSKVTLQPGEKKQIRFSIAWHYPEQEIYWRSVPETHTKLIKNYYGSQWQSSSDIQKYVFSNWDRLEKEVFTFRNAFLNSSLPDAIKDAITSNLATLVTPTIMRLEDGMLWGWEGLNDATGSCEGSCNHVWNYQQALAFLFPDLERGLREGEYKYSMMESGGLSIRQILPLNTGYFEITPCADGQLGSVIKAFREWKLSGDNTWLAENWASIRKIMSYVWSPENNDLWDREKTGVLSGRQHHTLDMELYSPSSWLNSFYLTALKATSEMATVMGDQQLANDCDDMYTRGRSWFEDKLFNGEYFTQEIQLDNKELITRFDHLSHVVFDGNGKKFDTSLSSVYWSEEHQQLSYQIGNACGIDQILGQWHANIVGLADIIDSDMVDTALSSIYRNNFKEDLWDHVNPCRTFGLEGESGTINFTWPHNDKQAIPVPYADELFTGSEYAFASLLLYCGQTEKALNVIKAVRGRYTGARRNPWSEIECGSNYIRALSSFSLLTAWSRQFVDMVNGELSFKPQNQVENLPWFSGTAWGVLATSDDNFSIQVLNGKIELKKITMPLAGLTPKQASLNGDAVEVMFDNDQVLLESGMTLIQGDCLIIANKL